jgi:hypothetical protein
MKGKWADEWLGRSEDFGEFPLYCKFEIVFLMKEPKKER